MDGWKMNTPSVFSVDKKKAVFCLFTFPAPFKEL